MKIETNKATDSNVQSGKLGVLAAYKNNLQTSVKAAKAVVQFELSVLTLGATGNPVQRAGALGQSLKKHISSSIATQCAIADALAKPVPHPLKPVVKGTAQTAQAATAAWIGIKSFELAKNVISKG